ncbi:helix-turn-helix transcriptional regulator [Streptococcus dentapri]|uniref:Helix-turn-helix transcriptional regulator n=1 Tax=Streptococcus dentapri TaxID=573564 RepID=A0ABV8D084_9STRE
MQESRLFEMVYYLLGNGKTTAPELAKQFEVSVRTIYRDVDALSSAGIPIYTQQGKDGGIQLDKDFVLSRSLLSQRERQQILDSLQGLASLNETLYDKKLLTKLSALFKAENPNWLEVDFSPWQNEAEQQALFQQLKEAVFQRRWFSFDYFSNDGKNSQRQVKPIRLIFKGQAWYLYAYCSLREDFRFFKLSRIRNGRVLAECFAEDFSQQIIKLTMPKQTTVHIALKFSSSVSYRVYDDFSEVAKDSDGNLYVEADIPSNVLESYLLSFGAEVQVLRPAFVRQNIKKKLENMLTLYKS